MKLLPRFSYTFFKPFNLLFSLMILYFAYHLLFSAKGLISYYDLKNQHSLKQSEIEVLRKQIEYLEIQNSLLNPNAPSADLLEEKVKEQFSFVHKNETLLINPDII